MRQIFLGLMVCLFWAASASAQVEPIITYKYYPVTAPSGRSMRQQVFADSPSGFSQEWGGRQTIGPVKAVAWASSQIKYSFQPQPTPSGLCQSKSLEVTVPCEITMPQLQSDDQDKIRAFNKYSVGLEDHERGHCRVAADLAGWFQKVVLAFGERRCETIYSEVRDVYGYMSQAERRLQNVFDHNAKKYKNSSRHFLRPPEGPEQLRAIFQQMQPELDREHKLFNDYTRKYRLNQPPRQLPPSRQPPPGRPLEVTQQSLGNLPEADQDAFWTGPANGDPEPGTIYKDKDGIWRNY